MLDSYFIRGAAAPLKIPTVDTPASVGEASRSLTCVSGNFLGGSSNLQLLPVSSSSAQ